MTLYTAPDALDNLPPMAHVKAIAEAVLHYRFADLARRLHPYLDRR